MINNFKYEEVEDIFKKMEDEDKLRKETEFLEGLQAKCKKQDEELRDLRDYCQKEIDTVNKNKKSLVNLTFLIKLIRKLRC